MSRWREALSATPMRLTLRLVVLFSAVSLVAFAVTWVLTNNALLDATDTTLEQKIDELTATDSATAIARAVARAAAHADSDDLILRFDGPNGTVGNYGGPLPSGKLRSAALKDKAHDVDGRYILRSEKVAGGMLTVGQDAEAFEDLREIFIRVLLLTLLPTALILLGGGMLIALRSTRRLAAIESVLGRLTAGDLSTRMTALPGPPDDLSRVGDGIDRLAVAQEASMAALRQISADIAHDLRTPIQRLAVELDMAREAAPDLVPLERAEDEIRRIVATFDALLRIAQIEGGSPLARFAPVDLGILARDVAELYEPAAAERGHSLTLIVDHPSRVMGDRALLSQAIANLVENALNHSPPGPVTLSVVQASVTVTDHGPGIPEDERGAVLRRLYRLDRSRSTPGSGLGLALVDAIVRLHRATLVFSDNQPGLCATMTFPVDRRAA